jgi:hypothetical protein
VTKFAREEVAKVLTSLFDSMEVELRTLDTIQQLLGDDIPPAVAEELSELKAELDRKLKARDRR